MLNLAGTSCLLLSTTALLVRGASEYSYPQVYDASTLRREPVHYYSDSSNTSSLTGYLAYQSTSNASRPAVLVLPDWDGISNYERWRADLFASMGYVGFVADIYGDEVSQGAKMSTAERQQQVQKYNSNLPLLRARLLAALAVVRGLNLVQLDHRIVAVGYCFGGGAALELMRQWPDTQGLVGVATFHGSPLVRNGSTTRQNNPIRAQVYNGFNDTSISRASVAAFEAEMSTANVTWALTEFSDTSHAFTLLENPTWNGTGKMPSSAYNQAADWQSWWGLRGFLLDVFGLANATNPYTAGAGLTDAQTGFGGGATARA